MRRRGALANFAGRISAANMGVVAGLPNHDCL